MLNLKSIPTEIRNALSDSDFKVYAKHADSGVELLIMEDIGKDWFGDGISAGDVVSFLGDHPKDPVHVRINSPGGLAYDGLVIHNAFSAHEGKVTATVEGLAFSAASLATLGADHVRMFQASDFGIHRALAVSVGNSKTMRAAAEWLDKLDGHLLEIYQAKTGATSGQINKWLDGTDDGTVFSANEALEAGFADEVIPIKKPAKNKAQAPHARYAAELRQKRIRAKLTGHPRNV